MNQPAENPQPKSLPPGRALSRRRKLLFTAVALALVLVLGELAARLLLLVFPDPLPWFRYDKDVGWIMRPGYQGPVFANWLTRRIDPQGFYADDTQQVQHGTLPRILVLADSTGYGFNIEQQNAYPERLDALLPQADVISLSVPGHSSYQGLEMLRTRGLALKPQLVIVSYQFNDRRYVLKAEDQDGPRLFAQLGADEQRRNRLRRSGLMHGMLRLIVWMHGIQAPDTGQGEHVRLGVETLLPRVEAEAYQHNLEAIAALAQSNGAGVMFLLLGDHPVQTRELREGMALLEAGQRDAALERLDRAAQEKNWFSVLAESYAFKVRKATAPDSSVDAGNDGIIEVQQVLNGNLPIRLDTEYQARMRAAAAGCGAEVVEGAGLLATHPELYMDHCHFYEPGHALIAEALRERILVRWPRLAVGSAPQSALLPVP